MRINFMKKKQNSFMYILMILLLICTILFTNVTLSYKQMCNKQKEEIEELETLLDNCTIVYVIPEVKPFTKNNDNIAKQTFYDTLSENEIHLLETTIQHEVGNFSKKYKKLIAELIYNRYLSDEFPNTITEVLFQKGQFQGTQKWAYSGIEIDNETKEVVKQVFSEETTSHPATFYYNPELSEYNSIVWFEYSGDVDFVFEHTEIDWGISYNTRFFV